MYVCICLREHAQERITRSSGMERREKEEVSCNRDSKFTWDIIQANSPNQANAARHEFSELHRRRIRRSAILAYTDVCARIEIKLKWLGDTNE